MPKLRSRARAGAPARPREFCLSRGQSDEKNNSLFGAEVPQIEHEHEHDSPNFGIWAKRTSAPRSQLLVLTVFRRSLPLADPILCRNGAHAFFPLQRAALDSESPPSLLQ
jgi:hypothetical protein